MHSLRLKRSAAIISLAVLCLVLRSSAGPFAAPPSTRMSSLPPRTLWAWERPEDLRAIDPRTTAIAFLDRTLLIGSRVVSQPRSQSLTYPANTVLIAVVRIQVQPGALLDDAQQREVFDLLLRSASQPGIAALQIDFDATRSQRRFYAALLRNLRPRLPAALPLSITALASWCTHDRWLSGLPIDEAVPMLFRMEPDRRRARPGSPELQIREPLCQSAVGLSTREPWPADLAARRVYLFADRGWLTDFALLSERKLP